jgi:hypothetical protein
MAEGRCPHCNAMLSLVGKAHRCNSINTGVIIHKGVTLTPAMAEEVVAAAVINVINEAALRQAKWRADNPDTNRQRAREGMRKLRAAKRDNASA